MLAKFLCSCKNPFHNAGYRFEYKHLRILKIDVKQFGSWSGLMFSVGMICILVWLTLLFDVSRNSYGHVGTVSSLNHIFYWTSLNKQLTSTSCTYISL